MNTLHLLLKTKIFQNISIDDLKKILPALSIQVKKYLKGEIVVAQEDKVECFGFVFTGELCITRIISDGSQTFVQKAKPTFVISIDTVCTKNKVSPYTIIANTDSEVIFIPYEIIAKPGILDEKCRLIITDNILTLISHENIRKYHIIEILVRRGLRERITIYLERQKRKNNSSSFTIPLNREQLAEYLSVNRSSLSYELGQMQKEGLIKYNKNKFTILEKYDI